jgi:hypothetical protein
MHDEVCVRVCDGVGHLQEQLEPRRNVQPVRVGIVVDARAVDVLEDQKGLARGRDAGIEEPGDVRVSDPREQRAFTRESPTRDGVEYGEVEQLQRDVALELPIAPARQPHGPHPPHAERTFERVRADRLSCEGCNDCAGGDQRSRQEIRCHDAIVFAQQSFQNRRGLQISRSDRREEGSPLIGVQVERFVEERAQ